MLSNFLWGLLFFLFLIQTAVFSQKNELLTLYKAIEEAEKNYPAIKAAEYKTQSAEYIIKSRKTEHLPALITQNQLTYGTANGAVGTFWPNEGYAIPTSGSTRPDGVNSTNFAFGSYSTIAINWPAFSFGKITARIKEAEAHKAETEAEYQNEIFQHKVKVTDVYLLLLNQKKIVTVEQQNVKRAQLLKQTITAASEAGLRPGVDTSYINAEFSKAKILLLQAEGLEKQYKIKLAELMGISNYNIEVDTMIFFVKIPSPDLQTDFKIENNPILKLYDFKVKSNEARANSVMKSYYPSIRFLAAGIARGSGISNNDNSMSPLFSQGVRYKVYNGIFGVYFLWNIMDYPRIRREYKSQIFESREAKAIYDEEKLKTEGQIENSELQYQIAIGQVMEAPIQLRSAVDAYNQSNARYQSGLSTIVELTQSSYILSRAQSDMAIAKTNLWRALLMKAAAIGNYDLFTQNIK